MINSIDEKLQSTFKMSAQFCYLSASVLARNKLWILETVNESQLICILILNFSLKGIGKTIRQDWQFWSWSFVIEKTDYSTFRGINGQMFGVLQIAKSSFYVTQIEVGLEESIYTVYIQVQCSKQLYLPHFQE